MIPLRRNNLIFHRIRQFAATSLELRTFSTQLAQAIVLLWFKPLPITMKRIGKSRMSGFSRSAFLRFLKPLGFNSSFFSLFAQRYYARGISRCWSVEFVAIPLVCGPLEPWQAVLTVALRLFFAIPGGRVAILKNLALYMTPWPYDTQARTRIIYEHRFTLAIGQLLVLRAKLLVGRLSIKYINTDMQCRKQR